MKKKILLIFTICFSIVCYAQTIENIDSCKIDGQWYYGYLSTKGGEATYIITIKLMDGELNRYYDVTGKDKKYFEFYDLINSIDTKLDEWIKIANDNNVERVDKEVKINIKYIPSERIWRTKKTTTYEVYDKYYMWTWNHFSKRDMVSIFNMSFDSNKKVVKTSLSGFKFYSKKDVENFKRILNYQYVSKRIKELGNEKKEADAIKKKLNDAETRKNKLFR